MTGNNLGYQSEEGGADKGVERGRVVQQDRREPAGGQKGQGQLIREAEMLAVDQGDQQQLPAEQRRQDGGGHRGLDQRRPDADPRGGERHQCMPAQARGLAGLVPDQARTQPDKAGPNGQARSAEQQCKDRWRHRRAFRGGLRALATLRPGGFNPDRASGLRRAAVGPA